VQAADASLPFAPAGDEWDFYLKQMGDHYESVMINFWFSKRAPLPGYGHLLWVDIEMQHPDVHGLGDDTEAANTAALEDALAAHVQTELHAYYVGRIRGQARWKLYFYGGSPDRFRAVVERFMSKGQARNIDIGDRPDSEWKAFREVLYPDAERLRWINDIRVVEALEGAGDPLTQARRVDHWLYFETAASRDAFAAAAIRAGFATEPEAGDGPNDDGLFKRQVYRDDFADIERIHAVVMQLVVLGEAHNGDYDGWETFVLRPDADAP
jgi:regulator of RNase E activity RraB